MIIEIASSQKPETITECCGKIELLDFLQLSLSAIAEELYGRVRKLGELLQYQHVCMTASLRSKDRVAQNWECGHKVIVLLE